MPGLAIRDQGYVPMPMCAVCDRLVERMHVMRNHRAFVLMVVVECHGEREECALTDRLMCDATDIAPGRAFVRKEIESDAGRRTTD